MSPPQNLHYSLSLNPQATTSEVHLTHNFNPSKPLKPKTVSIPGPGQTEPESPKLTECNMGLFMSHTGVKKLIKIRVDHRRVSIKYIVNQTRFREILYIRAIPIIEQFLNHHTASDSFLPLETLQQKSGQSNPHKCCLDPFLTRPLITEDLQFSFHSSQLQNSRIIKNHRLLKILFGLNISDFQTNEFPYLYTI